MDVEKLRSEVEENHHLISTSDNQILFLREWCSHKESDICVLINHGITAHSKPYTNLGEALSEAGYACYGLDLRGHGLSDGVRGDYADRETLVGDLLVVHEFLKKQYSRIIVLGHSLGVVTSLVMLDELKEGIHGLVFLSMAKKLRKGIVKGRYIQGLKGLFSSILNPSKPVIHFYLEGLMDEIIDPLFNFYYTMRFLRILNPEKFKLPESIDVPVFVGVGELDELYTIDSVQTFMEEINSPNKEFHIVTDGRHAIFPDGSWNHLLDWLNRNFPI